MGSLTVERVLVLHEKLIRTSGGSVGIRDQAGLESALAQPFMTFGGEELYPTLIDKAAAVGFSLVANHPFIDGNKRIGYAVMEVFLVMHGFQISGSIDEQERVTLQVASGHLTREEFTGWLGQHLAVYP